MFGRPTNLQITWEIFRIRGGPRDSNPNGRPTLIYPAGSPRVFARGEFQYGVFRISSVLRISGKNCLEKNNASSDFDRRVCVEGILFEKKPPGILRSGK